MFYACVSLSCPRLCHAWRSPQAWSCLVTSDTHEALFGCNHLGCIFGCRVTSCIPLPFSALCNDMLAMLVRATRWLSLHLYMLAYMFMHESCLLVCFPYFNIMKIWTPDPNLHLSPVETTFCWPFCYACHIYLACLLCTLFTLSKNLFLSIACLLISCSDLCMFTHGAKRMELGPGLPGASKKGKDVSMWI